MNRKANHKIVIVGGGYAGLASLVTLRENRPNAEITLVDPRPDHIKITQLHESFRTPRESLALPFRLLEKRFEMKHVQTGFSFTASDLSHANRERAITLQDGSKLDFDYLIVSIGSNNRTAGIENSTKTLTLSDFVKTPGPELLSQHLGASKAKASWITVVGSGASGIQFLFEIAHYIAEQNLPWQLRLVDAGSSPLQQFGPSLGRYVLSRMDELGIAYHPKHYFLKQDKDVAVIEHRDTFERQRLKSHLTLYFSGKSSGHRLNTNWFGQVKHGSQTLSRIFSAGDCSHFNSPGSNSLSAQSAVRKGRLVAQNIIHQESFFRFKTPYLHRDLGYVVSMGPKDAIGWVGAQRNVIAGAPALAVKHVVESQYDLLLAGTNTFAF